MLTVYQANLLALLGDFKGLRLSHIEKYMSAKHNTSSEQLSCILQQLRLMGKLTFADDYVILSRREVNYRIIKAFDVVMDLTDGYMEHIFPGSEPFTLMFMVKPKAEASLCNTLGVVLVDRYFESSICSKINSGTYSDLRVVFVLNDAQQKNMLKVKNKSFYTIKDDNGKYVFFKAVE